MNKAWMLIATLLSIGCGGSPQVTQKPPDTTLACAPDSDAITMESSGDALSLLKGSWKVCSPGGSGQTLDGIQIDADGSWRGLRTVGGDLVVDYTSGGPTTGIDKDNLPGITVLIDLWRYGGGKFTVESQVFHGPRLDLNFQGTGYAGGLYLGGSDIRPVLPSVSGCQPYVKPMVPTAGSQISFRLVGKWARCDGVGPFPDMSTFDGLEFTDTQFFALKDNGAGSLARDAVGFPPQDWAMQDDTVDQGPPDWVVALTGSAGSSVIRTLYFDESPTPRLYVARDLPDGSTTYSGVYQKIQ